MKIKKFNENKNNIVEYYEVRQIISKDEYYTIPAFEDEYEQNYERDDLDDVIDFVVNNANDYKPNKLKIFKITEEEIDDTRIVARKYNIG